MVGILRQRGVLTGVKGNLDRVQNGPITIEHISEKTLVTHSALHPQEPDIFSKKQPSKQQGNLRNETFSRSICVCIRGVLCISQPIETVRIGIILWERPREWALFGRDSEGGDYMGKLTCCVRRPSSSGRGVCPCPDRPQSAPR